MKKFLISLIFSFSFVSCIYAEPIEVAMDMSYPPFQFIENGVLKGVEPDILAEVAKRTGLEFAPKKFVFEEIFPAIEDGSIQIAMAAIDMNEERLAKYSFSEAYYTTTSVFIASADNKEISTKDDLIGKKIGIAVAGSAQEEIAKSIPNAKVVNGRNLINTMLLLYSNRIDAMIAESINVPVILHSNYAYLSDREKANLSMLQDLGTPAKLEIFHIDFEGSVGQGFMTKKGANAELLAKISKAIAEMKVDGTIKSILAKYGLQ
ncbi:MAG: amino acid ABC transporter substrate-binding protein [Campylobacter sp.]|nr:amino acid ABC transporter substrate-binding protein [Campylobacter sp.]MBO7476107.1 amino acid ABC transporter substrate-binding protein [Campylobacter sp.]